MEGEYQGRVKDGKLHGVGVCLYTDGSRYQGDWKAGLKSGRGTHSFASGDQFEGEWENGWMHGLGVYTWKIGDKYIGEVRAALRRLSGPAEDSCLSLARLRRMWPAACGCLAQVQRTYAPQHGTCRPRSAARSTLAREQRRSVRVAWAPACGTRLCASRAPSSRRCSLGGSTASARTRGARTASTWGSGRRARCMGMASRPTRQVRACDVVEEATGGGGGGGGSAPQCALLCAWHVWRGYTAAHGARVRHLRDVRLGRRGLAHSARAACVLLCALRPPAS